MLQTLELECDVLSESVARRCRAYIFPVDINVPIDVSAHAR